MITFGKIVEKNMLEVWSDGRPTGEIIEFKNWLNADLNKKSQLIFDNIDQNWVLTSIEV